MPKQARPPSTVTRRIQTNDGRTKIVKRFTAAPGQAKVFRKQAEDGTSETLIRIPVSSISRDRDGDSFTKEGLADLKAQFDSGKIPVFFDHGMMPGDWMPSYSVLDMHGHWVSGEIEGDILFGTAKGEPGNDSFDRVAHKVEHGLPVGASVGFFELESSAVEGSEWARDFIRTDLVETSFVGIPSNPDAVASALGMLAKGHGVSENKLAEAIVIALKKTKETTPMSDQETQTQETEEQPDPETPKNSGEGETPAPAETEGDGEGGSDEPGDDDAPTDDDVTLESLQEEIRGLPDKIAGAIKTALTKDSDEEEEDEDKRKKDDDEDDDEKGKGKGKSKETPEPASGKRAPASTQGRAKPKAAEPRGITTIPDDKDGAEPTKEREEKALPMDPALKITPYARGD